MRVSKGILCAALSLGALAAASPAEAQRVTRIVAFGDSYADDGNFFELTGIARPSAYANGRFSNGTNFVDTMGQILNVPIDNFAIGGAYTGNGNINGPGIPGFVTEYQSFLAGGGPAAFPRTNGRFGPNDLVVVSIGGNDARAYERSLGLAPTTAQISTLLAGVPAQAAIRVAEATTGFNALAAAGARNFTVLAGDVGRLPEVVGLPVAAVGSAYASAFNAGIQAPLANLANQGVIVNYVDINRIGDRVAQNPGAFGLISAGACPIACVTTNPALLDQYLFYVDNVHLTSAGFAIVGRYAVRQLEAPLQLEAQAEIGLQTATAFGDTLIGRLDLSSARFGGNGAGGINFYVSANTASASRAGTLQSLGYEMDTTGFTGGAEYDVGGGAIVGAAVNYSRGEADMETASGAAETIAWQVGGYAGWSGGGAFIEGYAGYGWLDLEVERTGVIDDLEGETDGTALTAGARAGYLFDLGGARVGPVIGLRYGKVELDAYTEIGDGALTLNVQDQETDTLVGSAGLEARGTFDLGGLAVQPYAQAAVEQEFAGDGRTVRYALTAAPTIINQWVLPSRPDDIHGRLTGGVNFSLGNTLSLQLNATGTIAQDQGNDIAGFAALRLRM
jgi:outer membrane lipase/esterase